MSETRLRGAGMLSVLVPVYNEEENLQTFHAALSAVLETLAGWSGEVIYIDDGSRDGTPLLLRRLHDEDPRVKVVLLARNFGSWNALLAGVHAASGDAVVWMSADMQDPPDLVRDLVGAWAQGADVVWGVRTARHDPWPRRLMARAFYRLLRAVLPRYPVNGMDVCLMDRAVARLYGDLPERHRFAQGLILGLGFTQVEVPYVRRRRARGASKWGNLPRLFEMAMDIVTSVSVAPLRAAMVAGVSFTVAAVCVAAVLAGRRLMGTPVDGSLWVIVAVGFFGGINLAVLGLIGEYIWRALVEVRGRPAYIVRERIGFAGTRGRSVVERLSATPRVE